MSSLAKSVKAVALMSTGLDSLLAAKVIRDMGIEVRGVTFFFRFDPLADKIRNGELERWSGRLGIPMDGLDITDEYLDVLFHPDHGYGSEVNPCIDCHLFMFRKAKAFMDEIGADFLVSGEVVGQRPMSQNRPTLIHIDKVSGLRGLILRPLSARLLPPTVPEEKRWVDREKLFDFSGRSRKPQMALAVRLGVEGFHQPAGGCILTDPNFARRFRMLLGNRTSDRVNADDLSLLRFGRHFWPNPDLQVVVGRDEKDNREIERFEGPDRMTFFPENGKGPTAMAMGIRGRDDIGLAASIIARYSSKNGSSTVRIGYRGQGREGIVEAKPFSDTDMEGWKVGS